MPTDPSLPGLHPASHRPLLTMPLAGWAEHQFASFMALTGSPALHSLSGAGFLVERAAINGFAVPGAVSAGGGCRLIATRDNWVALNLARGDDRDLLPALFRDETLNPRDDAAIAARMAGCDAADMVGRGRELGLALAAMDEAPVSPAMTVTTTGIRRAAPTGRAPRVIDLSALWAGPLAGHLFWLAGAEVVKVESRTRPDAMRDGDPGLFALLNQGKANVALDLHDSADRAALIALIERADMVIEAARPRALLQFGIDADALVARVPGLVWLTITGHGVSDGAAGDAAHWVGFGDDCSVAGGLSAALREATGRIGFAGDALADPITGIAAALVAWHRWTGREGGRIIFSMAGTIRAALKREQDAEPARLYTSLKRWAAATGRPMAEVFGGTPLRSPTAPVAALGQDSAPWLGGTL
ncbi:CoA transferase [Sphingobium sufflavum]|uniref:CoA transferase n=1 Tax=Sphingobium sufflavum TaxID=1129547 RepID=UPI001F3DB9D0|nr:CoA transferase [Sphingobium sufflavum]MCE7796869.1 CoA transferase [Sphingobium sufflavum]